MATHLAEIRGRVPHRAHWKPNHGSAVLHPPCSELSPILISGFLYRGAQVVFGKKNASQLSCTTGNHYCVGSSKRSTVYLCGKSQSKYKEIHIYGSCYYWHEKKRNISVCTRRYTCICSNKIPLEKSSTKLPKVVTCREGNLGIRIGQSQLSLYSFLYSICAISAYGM